MAKFSKFNQPKHRNGGRKPSAEIMAEAEAARAAEREREKQAFNAFQTAESGNFNGFDFVNEFHAAYKKRDALEVLNADDCAECVTSTGATIHTGADGVTVYIMTEAARNGNGVKTVSFNRSIYIF